MLASLVLLCATIFHDGCVRTEPGRPSANAPFDLVYEDYWPDTSVPKRLVRATVSGRDIRIELATDAGGYIQPSVSAFAFRIPAAAFAPDGLDPGTYRVLVEVDRDHRWEHRYHAHFALVDVAAERVAPRTGIWRAIEAGGSGAPAGARPRQPGIRVAVDARADTVRLVVTGFQARSIVFGSAVPYAWPVWVEGALPRADAHVQGGLFTPGAGRLLDGTAATGMQTYAASARFAIEWIDPRNAVLYLTRPHDQREPVTALPLVFDEASLSPGDLEQRWLLVGVRGASVVASSLLRLERLEDTGSSWNYRDSASATYLRCTPQGPIALCLLISTGIARATLECDADACEGSDTRGLHLRLTRWN